MLKFQYFNLIDNLIAPYLLSKNIIFGTAELFLIATEEYAVNDCKSAWGLQINLEVFKLNETYILQFYPFHSHSTHLTNYLLIPVGIYVCFITYLNTNYITHRNPELAYQFILSSRHSVIQIISFQSYSILPLKKFWKYRMKNYFNLKSHWEGFENIGWPVIWNEKSLKISTGKWFQTKKLIFLNIWW